VIFMDIQMPGIDGLTAAARIREIKRNETTPVVFVTVQSDFHTRAKSSLMGGTDLIAKPYLMFEITLKALMLAMRKRLQLAASCEREVGGYARPPGARTGAASNGKSYGAGLNLRAASSDGAIGRVIL
jgi:DNA-binding response OmpR family regulator